MSTVSNVIKESLVHGKYYNVYVTQVNTYGLESEKSVASLIRVGDVTPPDVPMISLDTSYGTNGFLKSNGYVNIKVQWGADTTDDDLAGYYLYTMTEFSGWNGNGTYDLPSGLMINKTYTLSNTVNSYVLTNNPNHKYVYIGIAAYDYSKNVSRVAFIRVLSEDNSSPDNPLTAPTVVGGVWQEFVTVDCINSTEIEKILIYRDDPSVDIPGGLSNPVGSMPFFSGSKLTFTDNLRVIDGLSHYYSYAYVDYNGNISPRSPYSATVTAKSIDTTLIDKDTFKALSEAWTSDFISEGGVYDIEKLKSDLVTQVDNIKNLSEQLSVVQTNYSDLFDKYKLLVNQYDLISASVKTTDTTIDAMKAQISLNSSLITQKVSQTQLDSATNSITKAYTSLYYQNSQQISTIVSNLNNNILAYSSISQLANQMQLKVSKGEVISAINLSPETIQLNGNRIHITGDTLFDKDVRILQNLYIGGYSSGTTGWANMPNNMIVEWGSFSGHTDDGDRTGYESFPRRFNCISVVANIEGVPNTESGRTIPAAVSINSWNNSGFNWYAVANPRSNFRISFIAIGFA